MATYERKTFYQDKTVAEAYSDRRFASPKGRREDERTKTALGHALGRIPAGGMVLDLPCGTGRCADLLRRRGYGYIGADISMEMLQVSAAGAKGEPRRLLVRCDGENLPFKNAAFDCVACVRFLNLVPGAARRAILREMSRVSSKWLIVQSHHLKSMGPLMRLKLAVKKLLGGDLKKYGLRNDILGAGWIEDARVPIQGTRQSIGIYRKPEAASPPR